MNKVTLASLLAIAGAPVLDLDAPLPITVTRRGLQTLAAHNAPVPVVRRRQVTTPTTVCGLCGAPVTGGEDCPCDEGICIEVTSSRPITTAPSRCCPVCHWETPCMCGIIEPTANGCYED